jgi:hypothetical protein
MNAAVCLISQAREFRLDQRLFTRTGKEEFMLLAGFISQTTGIILCAFAHGRA